MNKVEDLVIACFPVICMWITEHDESDVKRLLAQAIPLLVHVFRLPEEHSENTAGIITLLLLLTLEFREDEVCHKVFMDCNGPQAVVDHGLRYWAAALPEPNRQQISLVVQVADTFECDSPELQRMSRWLKSHKIAA